MSEYNEQILKIIEVLRNKTYLFPKNMPTRLKFNLYFEYFEKLHKTEFAQMPAMAHFSPDIMDQYAKNIVWTGFAPTDGRGGGHALHTLIQVDQTQHIIFLYAQEDNQVSVIGTLYVKDAQDYLKFMINNDQHIIRKQARGFVPFGVSGHIDKPE